MTEESENEGPESDEPEHTETELEAVRMIEAALRRVCDVETLEQTPFVVSAWQDSDEKDWAGVLCSVVLREGVTVDDHAGCFCERLDAASDGEGQRAAWECLCDCHGSLEGFDDDEDEDEEPEEDVALTDEQQHEMAMCFLVAVAKRTSPERALEVLETLGNTGKHNQGEHEEKDPYFHAMMLLQDTLDIQAGWEGPGLVAMVKLCHPDRQASIEEFVREISAVKLKDARTIVPG